MAAKEEEPALGVPYPYATAQSAQPVFYVAPNPHQAGMVPPNAVYGDPKGIPYSRRCSAIHPPLSSVSTAEPLVLLPSGLNSFRTLVCWFF
ncbi:hypothetical protein HPP92_011549 [Vanilla planifolia]|uniref:Uncharacterized protein n=1 Tax=Vanilla planifolia TaxID=51239 RepID=A0A835R0U2_VANPL|nr:hypothetical protein HPP92_011549 [Vanilla planifolia]